MKLAHVAIASAALFGISFAIAQTTHSPASTTCSPCNAIIVVPAGCGGGITVAPEPIRAAGKSSTTITWKVVSPGWQFGKEGIKIRLAENKLKTPSQTGDTFTVTFDPSGPNAIYKYDINLVSKDGTCSLDPTIVNY